MDFNELSTDGKERTLKLWNSHLPSKRSNLEQIWKSPTAGYDVFSCVMAVRSSASQHSIV